MTAVVNRSSFKVMVVLRWFSYFFVPFLCRGGGHVSIGWYSIIFICYTLLLSTIHTITVSIMSQFKQDQNIICLSPPKKKIQWGKLEEAWVLSRHNTVPAICFGLRTWLGIRKHLGLALLVATITDGGGPTSREKQLVLTPRNPLEMSTLCWNIPRVSSQTSTDATRFAVCHLATVTGY